MENTKEYFYFTKIVEENSVSKAARKLNVSQPFLSDYLKKIEKKHGFILFERSGNKLELTQIGKAFYEMSKNILAEENIFLKAAQTISKATDDIISIGIGSSRAQMFLDLPILNFLKNNKNVSIRIFEIKNENAKNVLHNGLADVVLHYDDIEGEISSILLKNEQLYIIKSKNVLKEFCDKWIVLKNGQKIRNIANKYCQNKQISIECETIATALRYCSLGLGNTIVPDYILNSLDLNEYVYEKIGESSFERPLYISRLNKSVLESNLIKKFINEVVRFNNEN